MTDQIMDQDVELDENEIEEAHDPKNAEVQSVASVEKAADATAKAPTRKGDKANGEKMPKTKAGMINAMYTKMAGMKKEQLSGMMGKVMGEGFEADDQAQDVSEETLEMNIDFSEDLNALVESEATLSEEFKAKTAVIFEAALKSKLSAEVDRLEESYQEELAEEVKTTKADLVEKVDSYLNYVVESWMEENKLAVQAGLRTEIAENFMDALKNVFVENYIDVPESKIDLVDELAEQVEELEEASNAATAKAMSLAEELETYKRNAIIREHARGLAETQVDKLTALVEDVDFESEETFAKKVATIKESYFSTKSPTVVSEDVDQDNGEAIVENSSAMDQYLSVMKKLNK